MSVLFLPAGSLATDERALASQAAEHRRGRLQFGEAE